MPQSSKIVYDFKKISEMYQNEYKRLDSLKDKEFNREEERINSLPAHDKEHIFKNLVNNITDPDSYTIEMKEIKKLVKEYIPKEKKSLKRSNSKSNSNKSLKNNANANNSQNKVSKHLQNQFSCLNQFTDLVEDKDSSNEWGHYQYHAKLKGKEVYVKQLSCDYLGKYRFENMKEEIKLNTKASKLGLTSKLLDYFLCKGKNGKYNIFFVYEKINGISLQKYLENNKLKDNLKKKIKNLIDKAIKNNILFNWLTESKLMLVKKGKTTDVVITSLNGAQSVERIVDKEKKMLMRDLQWLTKSGDKVREIAILSLVRDKFLIKY